MKQVILAAAIFVAFISEAMAQSKYDIAWTGGLGGQGQHSQWESIIINRQTNRANMCLAFLDATARPWKITARCQVLSDYKSHFPPSANVISKVSKWIPPNQNGGPILWQVDADTGAGEACSLSDVTAPGEGCASFTLQ
jgi:hypothetical protein